MGKSGVWMWRSITTHICVYIGWVRYGSVSTLHYYCIGQQRCGESSLFFSVTLWGKKPKFPLSLFISHFSSTIFRHNATSSPRPWTDTTPELFRDEEISEDLIQRKDRERIAGGIFLSFYYSLTCTHMCWNTWKLSIFSVLSSLRCDSLSKTNELFSTLITSISRHLHTFVALSPTWKWWWRTTAVVNNIRITKWTNTVRTYIIIALS